MTQLLSLVLLLDLECLSLGLHIHHCLNLRGTAYVLLSTS